MIHQRNVTFKTIEAPFQDPRGEEVRKLDIVELRYPDGRVGAFPADEINPEDGKKWCDTYAEKYGAFKRDPDGERKSSLEREIKERQSELEALSAAKPAAATKAAADETAPDFANMSDDDLRSWINENGGADQRSNASHASLVHTAEDLLAKAERRKAREAAKAQG